MNMVKTCRQAKEINRATKANETKGKTKYTCTHKIKAHKSSRTLSFAATQVMDSQSKKISNDQELTALKTKRESRGP